MSSFLGTGKTSLVHYIFSCFRGNPRGPADTLEHKPTEEALDNAPKEKPVKSKRGKKRAAVLNLPATDLTRHQNKVVADIDQHEIETALDPETLEAFEASLPKSSRKDEAPVEIVEAEIVPPPAAEVQESAPENVATASGEWVVEPKAADVVMTSSPVDSGTHEESGESQKQLPGSEPVSVPSAPKSPRPRESGSPTEQEIADVMQPVADMMGPQTCFQTFSTPPSFHTGDQQTRVFYSPDAADSGRGSDVTTHGQVEEPVVSSSETDLQYSVAPPYIVSESPHDGAQLDLLSEFSQGPETSKQIAEPSQPPVDVQDQPEIPNELEIPNEPESPSEHDTSGLDDTTSELFSQMAQGPDITHVTVSDSPLMHEQTPDDAQSGSSGSIEYSRHQNTETEELIETEVEETVTMVITGVVTNPGRQPEDILPLQDAVSRGVLDFQAGLFTNMLTREKTSMVEAINAGWIKHEMGQKKVAKTEQRTKSIGIITIRTTRETMPYTVKQAMDRSTGKMLSVEEAMKIRILDPANGTYRDNTTGRKMLIGDAADEQLVVVEYDADATGTVHEEVLQTYSVHAVVDQKSKKKLPFHEAVEKGIIDQTTGEYNNNATGEKMSAEDAIKVGFIKATLTEKPSDISLDNIGSAVARRGAKAIRSKLLNPLKILRGFKK